MKSEKIISISPLDFMWPVKDPFLFCVHHKDQYPPGNAEMGPAVSLKGRNLGNDFIIKDGWRMYHGETVPGFPAHPHRGFETVTAVINGFVDHSDSHGQAGRYGNGDVQWMTAGKGLQHCEMFPLINSEKENPLELFQIWLNLPKAKKFAEPHFKMLWNEDIPLLIKEDENGNKIEIRAIAGKIENVTAPEPAPDSWAADSENEVAIWTIKMHPGSKMIIPPTNNDVSRSLYFYQGNSISVDGISVSQKNCIEVLSKSELIIKNSNSESYLVLLQGKQINEPVVQYGPFVMNTKDEIQQAYLDYQETQFGGWPWERHDIVHPKTMGRFARHLNGKEELK